jgi:hypothetical protein
MSSPIDALPRFELAAERPLAGRFRACGATSYHDAAALIWHLPYGRTSDRADPTLVLSEGRGTCSTKHALLAQLAAEHGQPVELVLGIYLMGEANTPGTGAALAANGLDAIPEAHCYLRAGGQRIDLTHPPGRLPGEPIAAFLHEEPIVPHQIGAYKQELHRRFLEAWAPATPFSVAELWAIREACIAALGEEQPR